MNAEARRKRQQAARGIAGLAFAYFLFYTPYAALTKALTSGALPETAGPVAGLTILPTTVVATIVVTLLILAATGWWRTMDRVPIAGLAIPVPGRWTLLSGVGEAMIIGTTTLAYSFGGVSIVFMMLLMRGGVLIMSPFVDRLHQRKIRWFSWVALGLCLLALSLALTDEGGTAMTTGAWLNVSAYLGGYALRLWIMGVLAKSHDRQANLRYFAEEQLVATPILLAALALVAALGGEAVAPLRDGFAILPGPVLVGSLAIGGFYALLSLFGTLIYLDRNENSYAVPFNRSASLIAGAVASYGLSLVFDLAPPPGHQIVGAALLILAASVLAFGPDLAPRLNAERLIVFVCSGNTCRSPMAERLAMLEASRRLGIAVEALADAGLRFVSAGLTARAGHDLDDPARAALGRIGAPIDPHRAQQLGVELLARAEIVICLTPKQRDEVVAMAPRMAGRVHVLVPGEAIELPADGDYDRYATRLLALVVDCFDRLDLVRPQRASPA